MSRSTVYKETDRETRVWEDEQQPRKVTVTKYKVPEKSSRSTVVGGGDDNETKEKVTIRTTRRSSRPRGGDDDEEVDIRFKESYNDRDRDRGRDSREEDVRFSEHYSDRNRARGSREEDDFRFSERYTERDRGEPRRDNNVTYRVISGGDDYDDRRSTRGGGVGGGDYRSSDYRSDYRYEDRDRQSVRAPSPPNRNRDTVFTYERERDYSPQRRRDRGGDDDYEIERYHKETDYYAPAPQPQPIIIRDSHPAPQPIIIRETRRDPPIIIREERREPQYEFIERREVEQDRQLVKSEAPPSPSPSPSPQPEPQPVVQKQQDEDYFYERRVIERDRAPAPAPRRRRERSPEIKPKDSASNYSSDDSYEKVRYERSYDEDLRDPHHKRHLAEGAIAGAVGAEIIRHHRQSQSGGRGGRFKSAASGAAVGAIGAEVLSRVRSRSRARERDRSGSRRSRSDSRDSYDTKRTGRRSHRRRSGSRSRSRSKSVSRKQLAGLAGVAAIGALAGYALKNRGNKETVVVNDPPRRSRSRRRRASADSYMMQGLREENDKHRDRGHRNTRIAQAGLASAAAAGLWERHRSKSRGAHGRSKSKVKQGFPIAAAGLGGAALAGLYEKNKANKEAKRDAIIADETGMGGRRRARSRSRSKSVRPRDDDRRSVDSAGMTAGGYSDEGQRGYYSDEEPGQYRRRHPGGSSAGSSPDNRRRRGSRSRSRGRGLAEAGAAAGVAAVAAHEIGKRHHDRQQGDGYPNQYNQDYSPGQQSPSGYLPPQQNAGYPAPQQQYPGANYFPPPPTGEHAYAQNEYPQQHYPPQQYPAAQQENVIPPYNPADYAQPGPAQQHNPYDRARDGYGDSEANIGAPLGAPYGNETYAGDNREVPQEYPPREETRRGRSPENVSAPIGSTAATNNEREAQDADGLNTPRARSTSRVRFNLDANEAHSPEKTRNQERFSDSETNGDKKRRRRKRKHRDHHERSRDSPALMNDKYEYAPSSTNDDDSDGTEDMPKRFDEHGNRKHGSDDPLEALLGNLAQTFLGGSDDGRSGRRRSRY